MFNQNQCKPTKTNQKKGHFGTLRQLLRVEFQQTNLADQDNSEYQQYMYPASSNKKYTLKTIDNYLKISEEEEQHYFSDHKSRKANLLNIKKMTTASNQSNSMFSDDYMYELLDGYKDSEQFKENAKCKSNAVKIKTGLSPYQSKTKLEPKGKTQRRQKSEGISIRITPRRDCKQNVSSVDQPSDISIPCFHPSPSQNNSENSKVSCPKIKKNAGKRRVPFTGRTENQTVDFPIASHLNVHNSEELTFKALEKDPNKKIRFSELARQFISQNEDSSHQEYYADYPLKNQTHIKRQTSFCKPKGSFKKEQRSSFHNRTPIKSRIGAEDSGDSPVQGNDYQYQFPECISPRRQQTQDRSFHQEIKYSMPKKEENQKSRRQCAQGSQYKSGSIKAISQSLSRIGIPVEFKNQMTKVQYDRLTQQFNEIRYLVIRKIEDQVLQKSYNKNPNHSKQISGIALIEKISREIMQAVNNCVNANLKQSMSGEMLLKQSIKGIKQSLSLKSDVQKGRGQQQSVNYLNRDEQSKFQGIFSFEGTSNNKFFAPIAENDKCGLENRDFKTNPFSNKKLQDQRQRELFDDLDTVKPESVVAQREVKPNRQHDQQIQESLAIIPPNFEESSSLSSMGIPALLESLQIPQSRCLADSKHAQMIRSRDNHAKKHSHQVSSVNVLYTETKRDSQKPIPQTKLQLVQEELGELQGGTPDNFVNKNTNCIVVEVKSFGIPQSSQIQQININRENKVAKQWTKKQSKNNLRGYLCEKGFSKEQKRPLEGEENFFSVRYDLKHLEKRGQQTQVIRISPIKIRKKEEIMENLLEKRIVDRPSTSIVYE